MSVLELNELVKAFEEKFGVSATAVAVVGPASSEDSAGEEKSTADVELADGGANKIAINIKRNTGRKAVVDANKMMVFCGVECADA